MAPMIVGKYFTENSTTDGDGPAGESPRQQYTRCRKLGAPN